MNLPPGWQSIGGLPCYADGEWCVNAHNSESCKSCYEVFHRGNSVALIINCSCDHFSPAHFAAAEKLLRDHQQKEAERDIEEVFRSEHVTVFRGKRSGREVVVYQYSRQNLRKWCCDSELFCVRNTFETRPEAEAEAKKALMEAAK